MKCCEKKESMKHLKNKTDNKTLEEFKYKLQLDIENQF